MPTYCKEHKYYLQLNDFFMYVFTYVINIQG